MQAGEEIVVNVKIRVPEVIESQILSTKKIKTPFMEEVKNE
jgi:hypothetical protein